MLQYLAVNTMSTLLSLGLLFCFATSCYGTKCMDCQHVPNIRNCSKLTVCNSHELCFTEQVVTASGHIVFNSGCLPTSGCPFTKIPLIGKRSTHVVKTRSTDILTCRECCAGDLCNLQGCGTQAVPIDQRGPYCYTCDVLNPKDCTDVTVCGKDELCMLYKPVELGGNIYRGQCQTQAACAALTLAFGSHNCNPICCNTDLCNDRCGTSTITATTPHPHTSDDAKSTKIPVSMTTKTQTGTSTKGNIQTTTTKPHVHAVTTPRATPLPLKSYCNYGKYVYLHNAHNELCIYVANDEHSLSWDDARASCKAKGGDLVVLDTHQKTSLVHAFLSQSHDSHSVYWIGAKDFSNRNHFYWTNGHTLLDTEADWGPGEPDHVSHEVNQNCVYIHNDRHHTSHHDVSHTTVEDIHFHDSSCHDTEHFICERRHS